MDITEANAETTNREQTQVAYFGHVVDAKGNTIKGVTIKVYADDTEGSDWVKRLANQQAGIRSGLDKRFSTAKAKKDNAYTLKGATVVFRANTAGSDTAEYDI